MGDKKKKMKCLKGATGNFHMFIVAKFSKPRNTSHFNSYLKEYLIKKKTNFKTFHFEASAGGVKWLAIAIFSYYEPYKRSIGDALRR